MMMIARGRALGAKDLKYSKVKLLPMYHVVTEKDRVLSLPSMHARIIPYRQPLMQ